MTCIVGLVDNGTVWIGGDSAATAGFSLTVRSDKKVFKVGDMLIGFTSSFRMGQLLEHSFTPPKRHADQDVFTYMVTSFVDAVRACFKDGGFAEKHSESERGGAFLVGYEKRLFLIESDYQVGESIHGFNACGCGDQIALGAMYLSRGSEPKDRIYSALKAAEAFSAGVRAPFHILSS